MNFLSKLSEQSMRILEISSLIAVFGIILVYYSNHEDRLAKINSFYLQQKLIKAQSINDAIIDLRAINQQIRMLCIYNNQYPKNEFYNKKLTIELERFKARANLVKAYNGADYIFNQQIFDAIKTFVKNDENIKDICASNSPDDSLWQSWQRPIDEQIKNSIADSQSAL